MAGLPADVGRILALARNDRSAAAKAMSALDLDQQVRLVCEAPLSRRAELLELAPEPEALVSELPEAELCFTAKAIGLHDAGWMLAHATAEQTVACLDLDAWNGQVPDTAAIDDWLDGFAEAGEGALLGAVQSLDPEMTVLYLREHIEVWLKENNDDWEPPPGSVTVDGQFYYRALREDDDLPVITSLLRSLFREGYWYYFRLLQGVVWEPESETREWALRWRTGRLQDLGFRPPEEALAIYAFLAPEDRLRVPEESGALDLDDYGLPANVDQLPGLTGSRHSIFAAVAELGDEERAGFFHRFVALANDVAVADGMPLGDPDTIPLAIDKAARVASTGLDHLTKETGIAATQLVRRAPPRDLFRLGANVDPSVKPVLVDEDEEEDEGQDD